MSQRIAIVGAGPGGMATAMRLAAAGYQVSIYEAAERPGGRMRGLVLGPYQFDSGPTILQMPQLYDELFATCGLRFSDYVRLIRLDPNTRIKFWDGAHLDLSSDLAAFKAQLAGSLGQLGLSPAVEAFTAASELAWYAEQGIDGTIFGPGRIAQAHSPDEYVEVEQLISACKAMALAAAAWCGAA